MTDLSKSVVAFLGAGHMAEALLNGLVRKGLVPPAQIRVADVLAGKADALARRFGVTACPDNAAAVRGAAVCVLAMKPQDLPAAIRGLREALPADALLLSIAAGVPCSAIEALLPPGRRVVRVMPNTPCLVGDGVSGLSGGRHATEADLALAEALLASVGAVHRLPEELLDAVTAVSGSGPAYVFYLAEAMAEAAERLKLPPDVARDLVGRTIAGAARLMQETGLLPLELRRRVTSKGGTTEAAVRHLDAAGVRAALVEAIEKARARAAELARSAAEPR